MSNRRFFIEIPHVKNTPWLIRDRDHGFEIVETHPKREIARQRAALLNGRVRFVAEADGDGASKIKTIGRL